MKLESHLSGCKSPTLSILVFIRVDETTARMKWAHVISAYYVRMPQFLLQDYLNSFLVGTGSNDWMLKTAIYFVLILGDLDSFRHC